MQASDLVAAMTNTSVTLGWDAVFALHLDDINAMLFNAYADDLTSWLARGISHSFDIEGQVSVAIDLQVGPPLVAFVEAEQPSAMLTMWVTAGTITVTTADATTTMQLAPNSLQIAGIAQLSGQVQDSYDVVLDLAAGAFGLELSGLDSLAQSAVGMTINDYFSTNSTQYPIGTVFYSKQDSYPRLEPAAFSFGIQSDPAGNQCLLIYITTSGGTPGQAGPISLPGQALPIPDGFTTALFISCKALFGGVLAPQFSAALEAAGFSSGTIQVTATGNEDDPATAYSISVAPTGAIGAGPAHGPYSVYQAALWATPAAVMIPASAITIGTSAGAIAGAWSAAWSQQLVYGYPPYDPTQAVEDTAQISLSFPVSVGTSITTGGQDGQEIVISVSPGPMTLTGGPAPDSIDPQIINQIFSADNEAALVRQFVAALDAPLGTIFGFDFTPISAFALENLLVAGQARLLLQDVYSPADLLVIGAVAGCFSVIPSLAWVQPGGQVQLAAPAMTARGQAVTWTRYPLIGSIDQDKEVYTAPASVTASTLVVVTATAADQSTGVAVIMVAPPLVLNPASVTLQAGQQIQFIATQQGAVQQDVTWSFSPQIGQLSSDGSYSAPPSVTSPQAITVTAQSTVAGGPSATASVQLQPAP